MEPTEKGSTRLDKWLWAARCFKTRSQATAACAAGHVKIEGDVVKASRAARVGETVEVLTPGGRKILQIAAIADVRGPADFAKTLYNDLTPPPPPDEPKVLRERGAGRPTKRDRREIDRLRDDW